MISEFSLPWGKDGTVRFALPAGWNLKAVLKPNHPSELHDFKSELDRAMTNPIASTPLHEFARRGKTACVVIDDRTRPTPVSAILPRVAAELGQAGILDENITILIALGMKMNPSPDQAAGTISLIKLLKTADQWLYLTSIPDGIPGLRAIGMQFFNDMPSLLKRAIDLKPKADVVVLPQAGASFIAWD